MNTTLLTAGVAAIILAVVGGGASVFGATVPVIPTLRRQLALGLVGVAFLAAAVVLGTDNGGGGGGTSKDVKAYQQLVVAACSDLGQDRGLPPIDNYGNTDRGGYIQWVRSNIATSEGILNTLWERPVPDELKDEQANARDDANNLVKAARAGVNQLEQALPAQFSVANPPPAIQQFGAELTTASTRLNGSMSELAGQTCQTQQTAGGS
jgi:hypothetical protein